MLLFSSSVFRFSSPGPTVLHLTDETRDMWLKTERLTKQTFTHQPTYSSHMVAERGTRPPPDVDAPMPQMAEQLLEVLKIVSQDRILQQTVEHFVNHSEAKRADIAKAERSLAALMACQAAGKSSCTQVASDHVVSVKVFAEELKTWTEATQVLQSETDGADGHTHSLFQENSSAALQTSTDFKGFDTMTAVKQLAEQEHFATLAQLRSRISAIMKFGADVDNGPFVKVKDLITDLIRLQAEASPETSQKSHCDEEVSKTAEMKEDLETEVAMHSSKHETAVVEEHDLLSIAYKNAVDSRRAAWRVITSVEQKEKSQGEEQLALYAIEYIAKVENELQKIREGVLALIDKKLVPSPSTNESKAFYHKMKSDYYRYFAEFATGETKSKAGEDAWDACVEANKIAQNDLALSSVVAQRQNHMVQTVQMPMETPQLPCIDKVVDVTVATQQVVHVPQEQVVEKIVEIPQLHIVGEIVRDTQTSDSLGTTPVCQVAQTGHVEVVEIETPLPTESASAMFVSTPVTQAVKELVEASKVFSQDRVQQRFGKQTIEPPAISLAERVVEASDTRTQDKTQHVVNTQVQHAVNTVEAETPIIIETINQVTKHVEIPQLQIVDVPGSQTQEETVPQDRMSDRVVQKTVKELKSKFEVGHTNKVHARNQPDKNRWRKKQEFEATQYPQDVQERADLTNQRQVPAIRSVQKTVEVPWTCKDKCPPLRLHRTSKKLKMSPRSLTVRFRTSRTMMKIGLSKRARRGNFPCQPKQSSKVAQTNRTLIDSTAWSYRHLKERPSS